MHVKECRKITERLVAQVRAKEGGEGEPSPEDLMLLIAGMAVNLARIADAAERANPPKA